MGGASQETSQDAGVLESYSKPGISILNVGPFACQVKPSAFSVNDVKSLLDFAGWRAGSDGIRSKGGVRMSLGVTTYSSDSSKLTEPVAKAKQQLYCQIATQVANDLPRALLYETQEVTAYHSQL